MRFGAILVAAAMAVLLPSSISAAAESPDAGAAESQDQPLSQGELDQLVAPIALYPDHPEWRRCLWLLLIRWRSCRLTRWVKANKALELAQNSMTLLTKQDWDD